MAVSNLTTKDFAEPLWQVRDQQQHLRELIAADVSRGKRKAVIDQHAAIFILQGALDRLRTM